MQQSFATVATIEDAIVERPRAFVRRIHRDRDGVRQRLAILRVHARLEDLVGDRLARPDAPQLADPVVPADGPRLGVVILDAGPGGFLGDAQPLGAVAQSIVGASSRGDVLHGGEDVLDVAERDGVDVE